MGAVLNQSWMMCGAFLNLLACGFHGGYPAVLFRDLGAPGSEMKLSSEAESWVVSAMAVTTFPAMLLIGPILEMLGRKLAHIAMVLPSLIACLTLYLARDVTTLVIARLVCGFTCGSAMSVGALIIGEYSSAEHRGIFLNGKAVSVTLGIFVVHLVGMFFNWRTTALIGIIPSALSLLITLTWPESPAWLAYKGRYEDCKASFEWLQGDNDKAKKELLLLIQTQKYRRLCKNNERINISSFKQTLSQLTQKDFVKPTLIVFFVFVILESCGRHTFASYAVKFMSAFTSKATSFYYILAVDAIVFISSLFSCGIVKLFRRRAILFASGALACSLLISICVYLYLKSVGTVSESIVWLPMSLLLLYFIILNIGAVPVTMSLLGEIYPLEHRGLGSTVSGLFFALTWLIALKVTPTLIRTIEVYGTFFVYAICMIGSLIYLYFFLPETEGKTLQEIEHYFNGVSLTLQKDNEEQRLDSKT